MDLQRGFGPRLGTRNVPFIATVGKSSSRRARWHFVACRGALLRGNWMKRSTEERLFSLGCLLVAIGVIHFCYLALVSNWNYLLASAGMVGGWLILNSIRNRRDQRRHVEALKAAFAPTTQRVPHLTEGYIYGYPYFTLTFESETEMKLAEQTKCIAAFKQSIQSLYGHLGGSRKPFSADRAVAATYEGFRPTPIVLGPFNASDTS